MLALLLAHQLWPSSGDVRLFPIVSLSKGMLMNALLHGDLRFMSQVSF